MFRRRSRNDAETPSDCGLTVAFVVRSEHPSLRQLSHAQHFNAGYDPRGLLTCLLSQLSRVSSIGGLPIRDRGFWHLILRGSLFRGTWARLVKNRRATTLKLVKPIFEKRRRVTIHTIQALFDFAARFAFQKHESNHRPILLFLHFSKIRFHTQSKQNYESESAEISRLSTYRTGLVFLTRITSRVDLALSVCPSIHRYLIIQLILNVVIKSLKLGLRRQQRR